MSDNSDNLDRGGSKHSEEASRKFRATATLSWEFETDSPNLLEFAKTLLGSMNIPADVVVGRIRISNVKKFRGKTVCGEFNPDDVLKHVTGTERKVEFEAKGKKYQIRMNSHRYFTFYSNKKCVCCGVEGTKMFLERYPHDKNPHFNLYAVVDNELVLMTKDHIRPKAFGGTDHHSNFQTMCVVCNNIKGSSSLNLVDLQELRKLFDDNKKILIKKQLTELIEARRKQLSVKTDWGKTISQDDCVAKCDIMIYDHNGELFGVSVYNTDQLLGKTVIACIHQGQPLSIVKKDGNKLWFKFDDRNFSMYYNLTDHICKEAVETPDVYGPASVDPTKSSY